MTERFSSLAHVASGAANFTLLQRRRVAFLHRTATCRSLFKPRVSLLSSYNTIEMSFDFFLSQFKFLHLTLSRMYIPHVSVLSGLTDFLWKRSEHNIILYFFSSVKIGAGKPYFIASFGETAHICACSAEPYCKQKVKKAFLKSMYCFTV